MVYRPFDQEHVQREHRSYIDIEGDKCLPGAFSTMLSKVWNQLVPIPFTLLTDIMAIQGDKVLESREIRSGIRVVREGAPARDALVSVTMYDGDRREPRWMDIERGATVDSVAQFLCQALRIR